MELVAAVGAEFAFSADTPYPFDTSTVPDFPFMMHIVTYGDNNTSAFVAGDSFGRGLHGHSEGSPFVMNQRFVGGTETSP